VLSQGVEFQNILGTCFYHAESDNVLFFESWSWEIGEWLMARAHMRGSVRKRITWNTL